MKPAGAYRHHRGDIQEEVNTKDTNGDDITTWETVAQNVPLGVRPLSVSQVLAAQATQSKVKGSFVMRKRPGFNYTVRQRIVCNGVVYDVQGWLPDPESGRDYVTAPYTQGVNSGGF